MQEYSEYDKNGRYLLAIYCFACSGQDHANMHGDKRSKGFSIVFQRRNNSKGEEVIDFKCTTCGYVNIGNGVEYIKDYAIRQ